MHSPSVFARVRDAWTTSEWLQPLVIVGVVYAVVFGSIAYVIWQVW